MFCAKILQHTLYFLLFLKLFFNMDCFPFHCQHSTPIIGKKHFIVKCFLNDMLYVVISLMAAALIKLR